MRLAAGKLHDVDFQTLAVEASSGGFKVAVLSLGVDRFTHVRGAIGYTLADTPEHQVQALLHCLRHPEQALRQAEQGRETVRDRYDWASLAARLERVWGRAMGERTP